MIILCTAIVFALIAAAYTVWALGEKWIRKDRARHNERIKNRFYECAESVYFEQQAKRTE